MRDFTPADQHTREEIERLIDTSMSVEAGAGTGKTSVLVARVVETLRRGPHTVDEIAVMTFTDAAAAELASRIREGLELASRSAVGEERARLQAALTGLYRAHIETIHAFAGGLLRERPVEAALDPRFTVLDPVAAGQLFEEAWKGWLSGLLSVSTPELALAVDRGLDLKELRQAADAVHAYRHLRPLQLADVGEPDLQAFGRELEGLVERLQELLPSCVTQEDLAFGAAMQIIAFAERYASASPAAREELLLFQPLKPSLNGNQANWLDPGHCVEAKDVVKAFVAAQGRIRDALRMQALAGVLPLIVGFVAEHEEERRREGTADYDDLLIWARDLLRGRPEVREYFRGRFPRIFVDEFQDTDPLQAEIVMLLAAEGTGDPMAAVPREGRLFVVGDPKQSIYRFRRADIAVYEQIKNGPLHGAGRTIVQNFRSHPEIIRWANRVFDAVLTEEPGVQPANVHLEPLPEGVDAGRPPVLVVHGSREHDRVPDMRREEAEILARMARRAVEEERWPVIDRKTREPREARYSDIAILLPARTELETYMEVLENRGIPYRVEGSRTFFRRQEVRDVISCLKAIDDPLDTVSLLGALRSRAFACSDEDLFLWRARGGRLDILGDPPADLEPESVREGLARLIGLRRARRGLSLPNLVRAVLEETGLVEIALSEGGGGQGAANLLKLAEQAHAFAGSGSGLRSFARWLAEQRDEETDEAEAGAVEELDNVVRIATIHSSKGLEYPIVMLANLHRPIRKNSKAPIPDREHGRLHLSIAQGGGDDGRFATAGYEAAEEDENAMIVAEARRLLYVAVTRARDHIVIPVVPPEGKEKGMLAWLLPHLPRPGHDVCERECLFYELPAEGPVSAAPAAQPSETRVADALAARERWIEANARRILAARAEREVVRPSERRRLWERPLAVEVSEVEGAVVATGIGDPLLIGDALHLVMERADLGAGEDLPALVAAAALEYGIPDRREELLDLARACLASASVRAAAAAERCYREVPFATLAPGGELIEGRIDLVYGHADSLTVVDYKTDTLHRGIAAATADHRDQAVSYASALHAITGTSVEKVVFVYARAGGGEGALSGADLARPA